MAAQIRKDQPVARDQRVRDRAPELMIGRKWMKQNDRGPAAEEFITDFRVAAGDPFHALGLTTALCGRNLLASRRRERLCLFRHHNPGYDVRTQTDGRWH